MVWMGEREVAQFIEDQEVEAAQQVCSSSLPVSPGFGIELVHQVHDVKEPPALPAANAGSGDADSEVGLSRPGAANQHDVALLVQELAAGQVAHQRLVHRGVLEGESYLIPAGVVHDAHSGSDGAKVIATYVVEKGKPLASPAQ